MFQNVIGIIAAVVVDYVMTILWWFILFPVACLVSLPFILVLALFRRGKYGIAVVDMFTSIHRFWRDCNLV
jgi:hypothetical protein